MRHKTNCERQVVAMDGRTWIVSSYATPREQFNSDAPAAWAADDGVFVLVGALQLCGRRIRNIRKNGIVFLLSARRPEDEARWRWEVTDPALIGALVSELESGIEPAEILLEGQKPEVIS